MNDFRFAFRQLWKTPGFTFAAVTVLALGIGVNTAIFSLVNAMLFQQPAYQRPNEIVQLFSQDAINPKSFRPFSYPILREGLTMVAAGLVLGFLLAIGTWKVVSSILFEVSPLDPFAFALAPALLAGAALLATWLPARRATRISPMEALRDE